MINLYLSIIIQFISLFFIISFNTPFIGSLFIIDSLSLYFIILLTNLYPLFIYLYTKEKRDTSKLLVLEIVLILIFSTSNSLLFFIL